MRFSETKSGAELAHAKAMYLHCDIVPKPKLQLTCLALPYSLLNGAV